MVSNFLKVFVSFDEESQVWTWTARRLDNGAVFDSGMVADCDLNTDGRTIMQNALADLEASMR